MKDALDSLADAVGILPSYSDLDGHRHITGRGTKAVLLTALGFDVSTRRAAERSLQALNVAQTKGDHPEWRVVIAGTSPKLAFDADAIWRIEREDGHIVEGRGPATVPKLPLGRHLLTCNASKTWLLAAPRKLAPPPRAWGVTLPLAGMRTVAEGGVGTYKDLGNAAAVLGAKGAAFLGINPIHAGFPEDPTAASPYSPTHRHWLNTLHIEAGGASGVCDPLIDYPAEIRAHQNALRAAFRADPDPDGLADFKHAHGDFLTKFAIHQALSTRHGPYWKDWPASFQYCDTPEVRHATEELTDEIAFHIWAQFQADRQLAEARDMSGNMAIGLYLDLAVGTHPFGAETWERPDLFAKGVSIGAPPDAFSPDGQVWNLAPMIPHAMEAEGFASFAKTLRRQFQFAKLLRIDHILGFDRSFWATGDRDVPGAYVQMPVEAMLAVARIEAARAGATIIGEDLGNIPEGLRSALKSSGLLGCRLMLFERSAGGAGDFNAPEDYDALALASFSTHDLPTWLGWQHGEDVRARHSVGQIDTNERSKALKDREAEVAALSAHFDQRGMHGYLADTASDLAAVQIEDVFGVEHQPNLPGTIDEYPNWRQRLPVSVRDYAEDLRLDNVAEIMNSSGREALA